MNAPGLDFLTFAWSKWAAGSPNRANGSNPSLNRRRSSRRFQPYPAAAGSPSALSPSAPEPKPSDAQTTEVKAPRRSSKRAALEESKPSAASTSSASNIISRRVTFHHAVSVTVIQSDACQPCEGTVVEEQMKPSDVGKYYPASSAQKALGLEYQKRWPQAHGTDPHALDGVFCKCTDGCKPGSSCPCAKEGIGCWWEGWGCGCGPRCKSSVPSHILDEAAIHQARRATIRQSKKGNGRKRATQQPAT